jgi:CubicO group peptidase (beta-lactamase class C family)
MTASAQALSFESAPGPERSGRSSHSSDSQLSLEQLLSSGTGGLYTGGAFLIGRGKDIQVYESFGELERAEGERDSRGKFRGDEVFDIGSLTAPLTLAPLALQLIDADWIQISNRASRYLQPLSTFGKSEITLADLLNHRSGLPESVAFAEAVQREVVRRPGFLNSPAAPSCFLNQVKGIHVTGQAGVGDRYSPVGSILAGMALESATGHGLESLVRKVLLSRVGMNSTAFLHAKLLKQFAGTMDFSQFAHRRRCGVRERVICGDVRDLYSWGLGGISAHAGIFTTMSDLHLFGGWFTALLAGDVETDEIGMSDAWSDSVEERSDKGDWHLGWKRADRFLKATGLSDEAIGYISETGCGLFCDPKTGRHVVFLSASCKGESSGSAELEKHIADVVARGVGEFSSERE